MTTVIGAISVHETSDEETAGQAAAPQPRSLGSRLAGVAQYVTRLRPGERAMLRRIARRDRVLLPEPFWRIVDRFEIAPHEEEFWIAVIPLMVAHEYMRGAPKPGDSVASSGVSAARVERWLRLDVKSARREARRLLARLEGGFEWTSFGSVLFYWNDEDRRRFAREFFLSSAYRKRANENTSAMENAE